MVLTKGWYPEMYFLVLTFCKMEQVGKKKTIELRMDLIFNSGERRWLLQEMQRKRILFNTRPLISVVLLASPSRISLHSHCFHPTTTINTEINLLLPQRNVWVNLLNAIFARLNIVSIHAVWLQHVWGTNNNSLSSPCVLCFHQRARVCVCVREYVCVCVCLIFGLTNILYYIYRPHSM